MLAIGAALVSLLAARRWLRARRARWVEVWRREAQALGLTLSSIDEARTSPPRIEGRVEGRPIRLWALDGRDDGAGRGWRVRVEMRVCDESEAATRALRSALRKLHAGAGTDGNEWLAYEAPGRHHRPGELRRLVHQVTEGAVAIESLE